MRNLKILHCQLTKNIISRFLIEPQCHNTVSSQLSPQSDELPDGVAHVHGALGAGHRLVEVRELLVGDGDGGARPRHAHSRPQPAIVILLQTLQRGLQPFADRLLENNHVLRVLHISQFTVDLDTWT